MSPIRRYGKRDLLYGKRDLLYGKRDLLYGKRDLLYGTRDLPYGTRDLLGPIRYGKRDQLDAPSGTFPHVEMNDFGGLIHDGKKKYTA